MPNCLSFEANFIKIAPNVKLLITKISISGEVKFGSKLTATYIYQDADNDLQGTSIIKWYRADSASGKNKKLISGATGLTLTLTQDDQAKFILFEVTPKAQTSILTGDVKSASTLVVAKMAHIKLGSVDNKSYANLLVSMIKSNKGLNVVIKKEGKYYRIFADFADKTTSDKAMKVIKQKKYIRDYSEIK